MIMVMIMIILTGMPHQPMAGLPAAVGPVNKHTTENTESI